MLISSVESLQQHLQTAIELEHSTLPPYLCALYSLKDGSNEEARAVLQSVALEEMLHLTLAANILNAIGGTPVLDSPRLMPGHPTTLPHSDGSVILSLRPFSREAVEGFMAVERPAPIDAVPEGRELRDDRPILSCHRRSARAPRVQSSAKKRCSVATQRGRSRMRFIMAARVASSPSVISIPRARRSAKLSARAKASTINRSSMATRTCSIRDGTRSRTISGSSSSCSGGRSAVGTRRLLGQPALR